MEHFHTADMVYIPAKTMLFPATIYRGVSLRTTWSSPTVSFKRRLS